MINRRQFLKTGALAGAGLVLPWKAGVGTAWAAEPMLPALNPMTQPRFVNPLPIPGVIDARLGGTFEVSIGQFPQALGLFDPMTGAPMMTPVWGYNGTYPGPTFVAMKDVPINVRWKNELMSGGMPLPHLLPVDTTVHWADPAGWPASGVPVVTHLHGGHSEAASDGLPDDWFTPGFALTGFGWTKETYTYDNDQRAATLWYHDHALGITRLNVYAGLAGFYLLRDAEELALIDAGHLPTGPYEIGLAIQDRMFLPDGSLFLPANSEVEEGPEPSVEPEFFGDFILVNGKAWPYLDVEPRQYRFRLLNGSDSRFYNLYLSSGEPFFQIGTDQGLLYAPVVVNRLTLGPGERADVVIDFSDPRLAGQTVILKNNARAPFPKGDTADPRTVGQIMAFRVVKPLDPNYPLTPLPSHLLSGPIAPLVQTGPTRQLLLFEGEDEFGRLQPALGTTDDGMLMWDEPITEHVHLNDVEVWEVYNTTEDAHPIHIHLVSFQILSRQKFRATQDLMSGALTNIRVLGQPKPPEPNEVGWKDTAQMFPGEVTRVVARFDRPGKYVWHCHILSHEDHEMMRPYDVA